MAETNLSQSKEDTPLSCSPSNILPPQSPDSSELPSNTTMSLDGAVQQTFHRFPDLPPELRIEIWKFSLPHRVYTFPGPNRKFDFLNKQWTQELLHGTRAAQPSVIAHVCSEARTVALSSGSVKKIMFHGLPKHSDKLSHVWVDSQRDTVLIKLNQSMHRNLYRSLENDHLYSLLSNRDIRAALDFTWAAPWAHKDRGRKLYYDLIHGRKDCDSVIVDLQLDVTDEEAASTGLFSEFGANRSVLISIEETRQMSRLFDAESKFSTVDLLNRWKNFNQHRHPANLSEFIQRWEQLGAREMSLVRRGLDYITGVEVDTKGKDEDELREQAARAAEIRQSQPELRPVIMVSRGAENAL